MNKKKIEIRKLTLNRELISNLTEQQQKAIQGGLTDLNCNTAFNTCPWTLCADCTQTQVVQTNCPPFVCATEGC